MNYKILLFILCHTLTIATHSQVISKNQDKDTFERLTKKLNPELNRSTAEIIVLIGRYFMGTPYVARTLETEPEQLVTNLQEFDCTTFAENCLALARTIKSDSSSFDKFLAELQNIRYRNGKIRNYPSRLHYFSDWIFDNDKKSTVISMSKRIANTPFCKNTNFMSTHAKNYKQLQNKRFVKEIAGWEKIISERQSFYIPKDQLPKFENQLKSGDIIGITTNIEGLDVVHVGIVIFISEKPHLMHASSKAKKVIISETSLNNYLQNRKNATGIMVARPI